MGKSKNQKINETTQQAQQRYETTTQPTQAENEFTPYAQNMQNQASEAAERNKADYGNIMSAYSDFRKNLGGPTKFTFQNVSAQRPAELNEAYGGLREFANTGGYSPQDIADLRARGVAPIRAAYGNSMQELDRARALGGASGTPNYIAALSRAQRELPQQLSDATQNVNAGLADSVRQGRMFGIGNMGQLSSAEAGRMLQADLANQGADIQTQGMGEQSLQGLRQNQLASMGGQASLYGTTPAMASMFGNQALQAAQQRAAMEQMRNQFGLGLLNTQIQGYGSEGAPWWETWGKIGADAATGMFGT
jgi:hypothetical protein